MTVSFYHFEDDKRAVLRANVARLVEISQRRAGMKTPEGKATVKAIFDVAQLGERLRDFRIRNKFWETV